jgi:hypothetical protein
MSGDYVDEYQFITLSDTRRKRLLEIIDLGAPLSLGLEMIGVNPIAYHAWKRGAEVFFKKKANGLEPDDFEIHAHALYNEIEEARFRNLQETIPYIKAGMIKDWKAAAYIVEKAHPEHFGKGGSFNLDALDDEKKSPVLVIGTEPAKEDMDE